MCRCALGFWSGTADRGVLLTLPPAAEVGVYYSQAQPECELLECLSVAGLPRGKRWPLW